MGWGQEHSRPDTTPGPERMAAKHLADAVRQWIRTGTTGDRERVEAALANYDDVATWYRPRPSFPRCLP